MWQMRHTTVAWRLRPLSMSDRQAPKRPGGLAEESERSRLKVLSEQQDSGTKFGFRAQMRITTQKASLRMYCGRRYASAMLRKARTADKSYSVGD